MRRYKCPLGGPNTRELFNIRVESEPHILDARISKLGDCTSYNGKFEVAIVHTPLSEQLDEQLDEQLVKVCMVNTYDEAIAWILNWSSDRQLRANYPR